MRYFGATKLYAVENCLVYSCFENSNYRVTPDINIDDTCNHQYKPESRPAKCLALWDWFAILAVSEMPLLSWANCIDQICY